VITEDPAGPAQDLEDHRHHADLPLVPATAIGGGVDEVPS